MFEQIKRQLRFAVLAIWGAPPPSDQKHAFDPIRLGLRAYRHSLLRGAVGGDITDQVARKRFARRKTQELAKALKLGRRRASLPVHLLFAKCRPSKILDQLVPDREKRWIPLPDRDKGTDGEVTISGFSFIENPAETLQAIKRIVAAERDFMAAQIHFDDQHCIDISPYLVLAEFWRDLTRIFHSGRMPTPIQKVMESVGLSKALGMRMTIPDMKDVWAFPLQRRHAAKTSKDAQRNLTPQTREKLADEFGREIDRWLGQAARFKLSPRGQALFAGIITEILENAERHSDPETRDGGWSTAAFMARRLENGESVFRCYIAFLSVGASIAESLSTAAPQITQQVKIYCERHANKDQSRDTLATLMALQDTITRDPEATSGGRGGIGLQKVLSFVNIVGATAVVDRRPRLTIVSGRSCIQLREPYFVGTKAGEREPRLLWCNAANDPSQPPDRDYVFDLPDHFPGTIVGMSFVIDKGQLMAVLDAKR